MKILHRDINNMSGYMKLLLEDIDDIWHLYNFVHVGDSVEALTYRYADPPCLRPPSTLSSSMPLSICDL